jgi:hypothetical protein
MPCSRSRGASRLSSLPSALGVLGQRADVATFFPTSRLNSACISVAVHVQSKDSYCWAYHPPRALLRDLASPFRSRPATRYSTAKGIVRPASRVLSAEFRFPACPSSAAHGLVMPSKSPQDLWQLPRFNSGLPQSSTKINPRCMSSFTAFPVPGSSGSVASLWDLK